MSEIRMRCDHLAVAVNDMEAAYGFFSRFFPSQARNPKQPSEQLTGYFYWTDLFVCGFPVEMIQDPEGQDGFIRRFIAKRGEGFHHICIEVERIGPVLERLRSDGIRVVDEQDLHDGAHIAFISPRSAFGMIVQVWGVADYDAPTKRISPDGRSRFEYIALAVRDVDAAARFLITYFNGVIVRARHKSPWGGGCEQVEVEASGMRFRLLGPGEGGAIADYLEQRGEGFHHVALELRDFERTAERIRGAGVEMLGSGRDGDGRGYFQIRPFGSLIEVHAAV